MDRFRAQRGVTLVEALVAVLVGVIALLGLYALVDASNKLTKQETEVADVQQSARIGISELSRIIRQSRVGGLYFGNAVLPIANNGVLITNADRVSYSGLSMNDLSGATHSVRAGTDVIEVRGVLLGDRYILDEGNVTCTTTCPPSQTCPPCQSWAVTIPWKTALGFVNFPLGGAPSLAAKTQPFYFVAVSGENQQVIIGTSTFLVPVYVAGLVDTTSFTQTASTFNFTMDPRDAGAQKLNATTTLPSSLAKSIAGGAIDVIRFFVDEVGSNATADTHPSLVEAIWVPDPSTPGWDIQPLVEEVEDFQVAYGVDGITCRPPNLSCQDGGVSPTSISATKNADEWVGNVTDEINDPVYGLPISPPDPNPTSKGMGVDAFIDTSVPSGPSLRPAAPALHSVWISLVVKSTSPDFVYDGPGARGIKTLDSLDPKFFSISAATGRPYRRRTLSLAVSLRNNGLFDRPTPTPTPTP